MATDMKPGNPVNSLRNLGDFRELSARAEHERPDVRRGCSESRGFQEGVPDDSPVWDVWENIKAFYPGSTANWDEDPPLIWYHVLHDLTVEQMARGVKNLVNHRDQRGGNDFPPNAGQFRDLCLTNFNWEQQAHNVFPPLLEDKTKIEQGREAAKQAVTGLRFLFRKR